MLATTLSLAASACSHGGSAPGGHSAPSNDAVDRGAVTTDGPSPGDAVAPDDLTIDALLSHDAAAPGDVATDTRPHDAAVPDEPGVLVHDGRTRTYIVRRPSRFSAATPSALVMAFHGGGGTGAGAEKLTGFTELGERLGFIVAYPDALGGLWKDGVRRTMPDNRNIDDVGFISTLIDTLRARYDVHPGRVYAAGLSNGGHMVGRLAVELSHKIAAIGPVGATLEATYAAKHAPAHPVSVIYFHGDADPLRYFTGGGAPGGDTMSARDMTRWWVTSNGCPSLPTISRLPDLVDDGTTISLEEYAPCSGGAAVAFYVVAGGGHTWPGGLQYLPSSVIGLTSRDVSASALMWKFFEAHRR